MLCVIDEFTREALAIRVKRKLNSTDVLETLADLMILRGPPAHELTSKPDHPLGAGQCSEIADG